MDRTDTLVAGLTDEIEALQAERDACEQRIVEIDRVMGAARIMVEELTKKKVANTSPLQQAEAFSVAPPAPPLVLPEPRKPPRAHPRAKKPKSARAGLDKPKQEEWLAQWARDHGGIVRISEARPSFIAAGLTGAKPRNIYGNIMSVMRRSADFEQTDPGTFRWLPYAPPASDGEPEPDSAGTSNRSVYDPDDFA